MATVTAKIPVELNERLVATAEKFDRSKTDIIKAALQSYFDSKDEAINAIPVELTYISTGFATDQLKATLLSNLTSSVKATKFAALETLVTATAASEYEIAIPLYDPHAAGNPAKNLALLKAIS